MKKKKLALHWQMLIALSLGVLCGWLFSGSYQVWGNFIGGIGKLFLNAINMIVIPLVFLSTMLSVSNISDTKSMGRVAWKSFLYFIVTSVVAATVGVLFADVLRPGKGVSCLDVDCEEVLSKAEQVKSATFMDKLVEIVPANIFETFSSGRILPIIFFALLMGIFATKLQDDRRNKLNGLFESLNDVIMLMTNFIIKFAPLGVFAIVMGLVGAKSGSGVLETYFVRFLYFVLVVWMSLIVMGGVVLPIVLGWVAKVSTIKHLKQIYSSLMLAFSTCSSYSALPLLISDAKTKLGVSDKVASFTIPLGITFNKIGTVIYECVAVVFVSQVFNVSLSMTQQIMLVGTSVITVFGAPSVPMAGALVLAVLLKSMNLPTDCIGIFMAIDILCDMPKTMLNAYSVSCGAVVVARSEGEELTI
jgi:Na+/H+-dicarboxylate symporter